MNILFEYQIILFFFIIFGIYLIYTYYYNQEAFQNNKTCPDLLIQEGEYYFLYNSRMPTVQGSNPRMFSKLSDYAQYVKQNPQCPVLFLQKGMNTQGNEIYNVRGGTPMNSWNYNGLQTTPPLANGNNVRGMNNTIIKKYHMNREKSYAPFDPRGFDIGRFTALDAIHISGELLPISDSATDPNWGGPEYTELQVKSGKYIGNEVQRPNMSGGPNVVMR